MATRWLAKSLQSPRWGGWGGRDGREEGAEKRWEREILDVSEFPVLFAFSGPAAAEVERVTPTIILLLYFINYFWK